MNKRSFLFGGTTALALGAAAWTLRMPGRAEAAEGTFEVQFTEAEWKTKLSPAQYTVLREEGTESPWTSSLLEEHREGLFSCAACDLPLFDSATKFESGTGWPSFYQPLNTTAVGETEDTAFGMLRTEVHCARCGGHQGHVFPDGPEPTGLRYCINGVALKFVPKAA